MLGIGPLFQFVIKHRLPLGMPWSLEEGMAQRGAQQPGAARARLPLRPAARLAHAVAVHLPMVVIAGAFGVWLFYVQHNFERGYWARRADGIRTPRRSTAARSTTCRRYCAGSPATSATTTSITWRREFLTTTCAQLARPPRRCVPGVQPATARQPRVRAHELWDRTRPHGGLPAPRDPGHEPGVEGSFVRVTRARQQVVLGRRTPYVRRRTDASCAAR